MKKNQYLIIGGTTKAATTSLFHYLADHPEVTVTSIKETRFFIDQDYPLMPPVDTGWWEGADKFEAFFPNNDPCLRVDVTPDYLYSAGTPLRLKSLLPNVKIAFILRDPITRVVSWYKYAKQINCLPSSMTFREYIDKQMAGGHFEQAKQDRRNGLHIPSPEYFLSALEHGHYSKYLQSYIDAVGPDNVKVYFYEELCAEPIKILHDLCDFAAITSSFYDSYDFQIFNRSISIKNARLNHLYSKFRYHVRRYTHNLPIHQVFRQMRLWFDPIYYRLNGKADEKVEINSDLRAKLEAYYEYEIIALEKILGRSVPWSIKPQINKSMGK
ncbi:sulfotransferase domain-containing protein [Acaryochloris sp. IP29b_bin.148]|uniref:sulfotransferase family protein n=1 Tax=Acaryochloris sp. IP29b_bin.148 TaxID=2969218 RepID=UPI00260762F6|nr:sulfotransferase domain-containing protein [Acaryochloris sp. IP29b_bin.148]